MVATSRPRSARTRPASFSMRTWCETAGRDTAPAAARNRMRDGRVRIRS